MERAPLRPVPSRPAGPVDRAEALEFVAAKLPTLDRPAREALALVELAGCSRAEAADQAGAPEEQVADALARARKALRRSMLPLRGSGWCERAERQISDRLDGEIAPPGPARLAAHLKNCDRCVEHEQRLAQATDALMRSFVEGHAEPEGETVEEQPAAEVAAGGQPGPPSLRVVQPTATEPSSPGSSTPEREATSARSPRSLPFAFELERLGLAGLAWNLLFALAILLSVAAAVIAILAATGVV